MYLQKNIKLRFILTDYNSQIQSVSFQSIYGMNRFYYDIHFNLFHLKLSSKAGTCFVILSKKQFLLTRDSIPTQQKIRGDRLEFQRRIPCRQPHDLFGEELRKIVYCFLKVTPSPYGHSPHIPLWEGNTGGEGNASPSPYSRKYQHFSPVSHSDIGTGRRNGSFWGEGVKDTRTIPTNYRLNQYAASQHYTKKDNSYNTLILQELSFFIWFCPTSW